MKRMLLVPVFLFASAVCYASTGTNTNCDLAQKELNLVKSQLEMLIAKYKLAVKENVKNQLKAGGTTNATGGRKITLNVDANSQVVKGISKLSLAAATFEATLEMCKEGLLKPEASNAVDGYKAQIIPTPDAAPIKP